jgi:hypothetical protein
MLFVGGSGDYYLTLRKASAAGGSPFIFLMQKLGLENLRLGSLHNSRGEKLTLFFGQAIGCTSFVLSHQFFSAGTREYFTAGRWNLKKTHM